MMSESIGTAKAGIKEIEEAIDILDAIKKRYHTNDYIVEMADEWKDDLASDLHTMRDELTEAEGAGYE
jgi:hypothetical protein